MGKSLACIAVSYLRRASQPQTSAVAAAGGGGGGGGGGDGSTIAAVTGQRAPRRAGLGRCWAAGLFVPSRNGPASAGDEEPLHVVRREDGRDRGHKSLRRQAAPERSPVPATPAPADR